jgi:hypothetical protein
LMNKRFVGGSGDQEIHGEKGWDDFEAVRSAGLWKRDTGKTARRITW